MINLYYIRKELDKIGLNLPIHVFGSLDPITSILYFLVGAEIFDGLTWLKYSYFYGAAIYIANYGVLDVELGINLSQDQVRLLSLVKNTYYLEKMKRTMIDFAKNQQFQIGLITVYDNDYKIFNAIKSGAYGYLLKETKAEKIYEAIGETLSGGAAMSPSIAMKTLKLLKNPVVFENPETSEVIELSTREIEVLEQLSKGLKNKDIADNLFISFSTVKKHIENIYKKLQAHNRIELIQKAKQNKLI